MAVKHGNETHLCSHCPKVFKSAETLRHHERNVHTLQAIYKCDQCGKVFKKKEVLNQHLIDLHTPDAEKPFLCELVQSINLILISFKFMIFNNAFFYFSFPGCGRGFSNKHKLEYHKPHHTKEKKHSCELCGAAFRRIGDLVKHRKKYHDGGRVKEKIEQPKKFGPKKETLPNGPCDQCGKKFK